MAKKTKRKGKAISNLLYNIGIIVAFAGICFIKDNFLLGIKYMPVGLVIMFVGWLLGDISMEA